MLPIVDITGETHWLANMKQVTRIRKVNGEKTLSFLVVPDEVNAHAWDAADNESTLGFLSDPYIIKKTGERSVGNTSIKQLQAVHSFFNRMINCQQYNRLSGSQTFFAALTHVFSPTPYDFSLVDSFSSVTLDNFGRDNCLSLFQQALELFGAEFRVVGMRVYLEHEIGADTGFQYRWKYNVKAISRDRDTNGLATVIRGFGGEEREDGTFPVEVEYRSPNEAVFGELIADPIYDTNITTDAEMLERLKKELTDEPQLSITVDLVELGLEHVNEGDRGYIIYEPMNITVSARVVEIDETFEYINKKWTLVKTAVTLSNVKERLTDITTRFSQTKRRVDRLFAGQEKVPYSVLPEAVRIASEAINNSLTEIKYPEGQGIVLQDPDNPNILVRLTSGGIGVSDDGGVTYRTAMTGTGIVADEIVTGVLRANNVMIEGEKDLFFWDGTGLFAYDPADLTRYVRLNSSGLHIAKGAMTIERPDGYAVMNNGLLQNEFAIQPTSPQFNSAAIDTVNRYWKTTSTTAENCNAFFYGHYSRFLKVRVIPHDNGMGNGSCMSIHEIGNGGAELAQTTVYGVLEADSAAVTLTIDLGTPTGAQRGFYIRLNTINEGEARGRMLKAWLEG